MTPAQHDQAAAFLMAAWDARRREPSLPEGLKPADEAQAAAINEAIHRRNTRAIAGWKIGATGPGPQKALGLSAPFTGFIPAEGIDANDVVYRFADMMRPVVESEYALRIGRDLPPRAEPYRRAEVEEAISALIIGFEIPESRLGNDHGLGALATVADHGGTGRFVIGHEFTDWRDIDCVNQPVVLTFDGKEVGRGTGAAMMGHPVEAVTWFVNHLSRRGITLSAGCFVTTGSCTGVIPAPGPCQAVADFGPLGTVRATFV
ncbi:MAG: 2-keto-4-pentenoate hydratase [Rubrivivax sp.]